MTHLVPSGGQQGKTVEVLLRGTLNGGDKRTTWSSHPGLDVSFGKKADRVQIAIKADVPPGRHFLRFANAGAASALLPFVVSPIAEVNEKEPNGKLPEAQKLEGMARVVNGVLSETRDVDVFEVSMKAGQTLVASMMANTGLGSPMDGLLQVVSEKGFVLSQDDDSLGLDPFVAFTAPTDGRFFVRTFAFPSKTNSTI
ncbi:MAG: PPC domain-containing protein, partial [Planctomycetota bacterium]|nr:PPC domain-containing protein [Planctomycetota bacterium]